MKKIRCVFSELNKELSKTEYASWWILRICMAAAAIYKNFTSTPTVRNLILLNLLATFTAPLLRILFSKKVFFSKITFRTQTYINFFVFLGSFLGHGFSFYSTVYGWDKLLHVVSGGVIVFMGCEIIKIMEGGNKLSPELTAFACSGFSFTVMVLWELMEFFSDYYITGSCNQGFNIHMDDAMLFFKIFGKSKNAAAQWPVFDTGIDLFYAVVTCVISTVLLFAFLKHKENKEKLKEENREEKKETIQL